MERFTEEEMEYLKQFEHHFSCVIDSQFLRSVGISKLARIKEIWERVTGKPYTMLKDCGRCEYTFLESVGRAYRHQKAEPAVKPAAVVEPKPKRKYAKRKTANPTD